MESEVLARFTSFSLSTAEGKGVELNEEDVSLGIEEGKVFGEKKANFVGVKSTMFKIWNHKGLCKVKALSQNIFQFVFKRPEERDEVLERRPWLFDNFLLVLLPWEENVSWTDDRFNFSPL